MSGLLGHSDLQTTAGYAQFAEAPVRDAAARVVKHLETALASNHALTAPEPCAMVSSFLSQGLRMDAYAEENGLSLSTLRQKCAAYFKAVREAHPGEEAKQ